MRLYRGLKRPYRRALVAPPPGEFLVGTNFTDCAFTALRYADGPRGVVLVVDAPEDGPLRVSEEFWGLDGRGPRRLMVWGPFDEWLVLCVPAKELRSVLRTRKVGALDDAYKGRVLHDVFDKRLLSVDAGLE